MNSLRRCSQRRILACLLLLVLMAWHPEAKAGQLTLTWTNNSVDESGFGVERKTGAAETFVEIATLGPGLNYYIDSYLASGTTYCYRVRAFNTAGYSADSNEACGETSQNVSAEITTPTPGSTLTASIVTFTWSTGNGVSEYWLEVGRTLGGYDIYSDSQGTTLSRAISGLPMDGSPVYVRLWSVIDGNWLPNDYTYNVAKAEMTSPAMLTAGTVTFTWSAGGGVSEYWLQVGRALGAGDIYSGSPGMTLSMAISGLPMDGSPVYVRLWSVIDGNWLYNDYAYSVVEAAVRTQTPGLIVSKDTLRVPVFGTMITHVADHSIQRRSSSWVSTFRRYPSLTEDLPN